MSFNDLNTFTQTPVKHQIKCEIRDIYDCYKENKSGRKEIIKVSDDGESRNFQGLSNNRKVKTNDLAQKVS